MYQDDLFEDETAVVTGASRGLGRAIAYRLAECGADVVVAARSGDTLATVADEIESETASDALDVPSTYATPTPSTGWSDGRPSSATEASRC